MSCSSATTLFLITLKVSFPNEKATGFVLGSGRPDQTLVSVPPANRKKTPCVIFEGFQAFLEVGFSFFEFVSSFCEFTHAFCEVADGPSEFKERRCGFVEAVCEVVPGMNSAGWLFDDVVFGDAGRGFSQREGFRLTACIWF